MGDVVILHPKSCLKKHPTTMKSRRTIKFAHNSTNPSTQIHSFTIPDTRTAKGILKNPSVTQNKNKDLVMGQVKILKRGEALPETSKEVNRTENSEVKGHRTRENKKKLSNSRSGVQVLKSDVVVSSTNRIGPDPKIVSKHMKNKISECFSGTVFSDSPHPSSVPLPFFIRNRAQVTNSS